MSSIDSSSVADRTAAPAEWTRELSACVAGALAGLAPTVTLGLLAYVALGEQAATIGMPAAFFATVAGGSLFTLLARGAMPVGGPGSVTTLMLAALVAGIVADPACQLARPADLAALLALTATAVVAMGILQIVFAACGLTDAAKYVPQPVLAGFMNGVAIVFVTAQLPALLGLDSAGPVADGSVFARIQPATLAVGMLTIVVIRTWSLLLRRPGTPGFARALPGSFVGLVLGCVAYAVVELVRPAWMRSGGVLGHIPSAWLSVDRLAPFLGDDATGLLRGHVTAALVTGLLMASIGTLDLVLNSLALDQAVRARTRSRHELVALGIANIVSGFFGGLPMQMLRARALITYQAGRRRRGALLVGNALLALLALTGGTLLGALPKVVLAAVMAMSGLLLFDAWSLTLASEWLRGRRSARTRLDLALVLCVCVVSVIWGFAVGVATGALLAVVLFIRGMNRSLVRAHRTAAAQPSRRIYGAAQEAVLQTLRARITILELEGALFFGTAARLTRRIDALDADCRTVVMDLRRVGLIDASGAVVLSQIHRELEERGVSLLLAGVALEERHGHALAAFVGAALPTNAWHVDVDRAVEAAELQALEVHGVPPVDEAVPLAQSSLMIGLDAVQCGFVETHLQRQSLVAGERLFGQGDAGDRLYVLASGSISVVGAPVIGSAAHAATPAPALRIRFVTCSPGMMLGEIAMLDGGGRSAEAVADRDTDVFVLTAHALAAIEREQPAVSARLHRNIALHLANRLRVASTAQHASSG